MDIVFWDNYFYSLTVAVKTDHCLVLFTWVWSLIVVFICQCRVENQ